MMCPCKGCEFRRPAFWGVCEQYKDWKSAIESGKRKARFSEADGLRADGIYKTRRRRGLK